MFETIPLLPFIRGRHSMSESFGTQSNATILASQLTNPRRPTICPTCFYSFCSRASEDIEAIGLHDNCGFWDACVALLALDRSDAEVEHLGEVLLANYRRCNEKAKQTHTPLSIGHAMPNPTSAGVVRRFIDSLCGILCLAFDLNAGTKRASRSPTSPSVINWPQRPEQLVPHGARNSTRAYIRWACEVASPDRMRVLGNVLSANFPVIFPKILDNRELHLRLLRAMTRNLDMSRWKTAVAAEPRCWFATDDYGAFLLAQRDTAMNAALQILGTIMTSPDMLQDGFQLFTRGTEAELLPAVQHAFRTATTSRDAGACFILAQAADSLHCSHPKPAPVLHPEIIVLLNKYGRNPRSASVPAICLIALQLQASSRRCAAADCNASLHYSYGTILREPFRRCSRCKWVRYCRRECQMHDWEYGHETMCPVITRILQRDGLSSLAALSTALHAEGDDAYDEDMGIVIEWTFEFRMLPGRFRDRLLDILPGLADNYQ